MQAILGKLDHEWDILPDRGDLRSVINPTGPENVYADVELCLLDHCIHRFVILLSKVKPGYIKLNSAYSCRHQVSV